MMDYTIEWGNRRAEKRQNAGKSRAGRISRLLFFRTRSALRGLVTNLLKTRAQKGGWWVGEQTYSPTGSATTLKAFSTRFDKLDINSTM